MATLTPLQITAAGDSSGLALRMAAACSGTPGCHVRERPTGGFLNPGYCVVAHTCGSRKEVSEKRVYASIIGCDEAESLRVVEPVRPAPITGHETHRRDSRVGLLPSKASRKRRARLPAHAMIGAIR